MPDRIWLFDTVVLSNFLLAAASDILKRRYAGRASITGEVYAELAAGMASRPGLETIDELLDGGVFQVLAMSGQERREFAGLIGHLGKGEASSIAVARRRSVIMVTDDRAARRECARMDIPVTGTIGILKASWRDQQLTLEQADRILVRMVEAGVYSPVRSIADIA